MDIHLLVLDLDGTIVGSSNSVNDSVKETIAQVKSKGIEVVLATGRMYKSAKLFHEYLNLSTPIIAYNGAWLQDPLQEKLLKYQPVTPDIARELIDYYEQSHLLSEINVHFYHQDRLYVRQMTSESESYARRSSVVANYHKNFRTLTQVSPTKLLAYSSNVQLIAEITQDLQKIHSSEKIYITQSAETLIEANHPNATKGKTTRYLAEKIMGMTSNNVMAIGDNFNDLELLQYAGIGVAMGNSHPDIQLAAKWVAPTIEEDGAKIAMQKFLL